MRLNLAPIMCSCIAYVEFYLHAIVQAEGSFTFLPFQYVFTVVQIPLQSSTDETWWSVWFRGKLCFCGVWQACCSHGHGFYPVVMDIVSRCHWGVAFLSSCCVWLIQELLWVSRAAWWGCPLMSLWWGPIPGDWAHSPSVLRHDQRTLRQCHILVALLPLLPYTCHK